MSILRNKKVILLLGVCVASIFSLFSSETPHSYPSSRRISHTTTPMSLASSGELLDEVFFTSSSKCVVKLCFSTEDECHDGDQRHVTADDNLGLARLFISSTLVNAYSEEEYLKSFMALSATKYRPLVDAISSGSADLPGVEFLNLSLKASDTETAVSYFAQGVIDLYAYAISIGGTADGTRLDHVCEHIDESDVVMIDEVVRLHMPNIVIHYVKTVTQQLRQQMCECMGVSLCSDEPVLTAFWKAIGMLDLTGRSVINPVTFSSEQKALHSVMNVYQRQRVSKYKETYAKALELSEDMFNTESDAARTCEMIVLENGWI